MEGPLETIRQYVLNPDPNGLHLRQLAQAMAQQDDLMPAPGKPRGDREKLEEAAGTIARFLYLVWGVAGPEEYAPRTYEMLMNLQRRVRGMAPGSTWEYALSVMGQNIRHRLARAERITIDPDMETALTHQFFDSLEEHKYLHDVAEGIMDLHWRRRHGPEAITTEEVDPSRQVCVPRGEAKLERHLARLAREGLATYIEQANIAWGNMEHPTDPTVVLRDRIDIQLGLGGENAETWEESGRRLADLIERRFGTRDKRREARAARAALKGDAQETKDGPAEE